MELMWLFFCCVCSFCLFILFVSHIQPYLMKEFLRAKKNDDDSWWFSLMNIIIIFIIIIIQWFCHLIYSNSDFFSFILLSFFFVQIIQFSVLFNFRIFRVFSVCRRCWLTTTTNQPTKISIDNIHASVKSSMYLWSNWKNKTKNKTKNENIVVNKEFHYSTISIKINDVK